MKNQPTSNAAGVPLAGTNATKFGKQQLGGNMFYLMPNNPQG